MKLHVPIAWATIAFMAGGTYLVPPSSAASKKKQPTHHNRFACRRHFGSYLVPPPPAYKPDILPELKMTNVNEPTKPVNTYKKYIYSKQGYEDPPPVKPNKYVTYWNSKS